MSTGQTMTTFDAALKDYYTDQRVEQMIYEDNPFLGLIEKWEKFPGRRMPLPIVYGNPQSRSATFSQAQGMSTSEQARIESFDLTRVKDYGVVTVETEAIEASEGDEGAFMEAKVAEIDGIINSLMRSLAIGLFRGGWGAIGTIGAISGATITLSPTSDAHNFEKGMQVQFSQTESANTLRNSAGYLVVSAVNRNTGVITFTANVSTLNAVAVGDTCFVKGDRQDSATPSRLKVTGLEGWCPVNPPSSGESFYGVDRSVESRLYGTSYNGAGDDIEDAFVEILNRVAALGYAPDFGFTSFVKYSALEKNLHDLARYIDIKPNQEASWMYRGLTLNGPRGPVKIVPDQNCLSTRAFFVQKKYIKLYTLGKAIRPFNADGMMMLRQSADDGVEIRYGFKGNVGCRAPASLGNLQL